MGTKKHKSSIPRTHKGQLVDPVSAILSLINIFVNLIKQAIDLTPNWLRVLIFMGAVAGIFLMLNTFFELEIPPAQLRGLTDFLGIGLLKGKWGHRVFIPAECTASLNLAQKVDIRNGTACTLMKDCIASETNQTCECSCSPESTSSTANYMVWLANLGGLNPIFTECVQATTEGAKCNLICPEYCGSKPDLVHNTSAELTPDLPPDTTVSAYAFCADNNGLSELDSQYSQALQNYVALDCIHRGFDYLNYRLVIEVELIMILLYISFIILFPIIVKQT